MAVKEFLLDLIFPRTCVSCGVRIGAGAVCTACIARIARRQTFFCGRCRARIPGTEKICHKDVPYLAGAAGDYGDPVIKNLVHALKFTGIRDASIPLGKILSEFILRLPVAWDEFTLVPIPLSPKRLRERGYNQAELISRVVSRETGIPLRTDILVRAKDAPAQSTIKGHDARMKNVAGCFALDARAAEIPAHIALVDDVTTSGATLDAAARALKAAGVKKIIALAVARA